MTDNDDDRERREALESQRVHDALDPITGPDALKALVAAGGLRTRFALTCRRGLGADLQRVLALDESSDIRRAVAGTPQLDSDVARTLSADSSPLVLDVLASNPQTPTDVLAALAGHADGQVRQLVAKNPASPDDVCHHLLVPAIRSQDSDAIARASAGWPADVIDAVVALTSGRPDLGDDELLAVALATVQPAA